jgi:septal ring-binding cell division protein DamX
MLKKHLSPLLCALCLAVATPAALAADIPASDIQLKNLTVDQLQQAAEAGDPDAQYALGYMYYYGKNVPQDSQQAKNWIKRAAVQGQDQANKALSMMQSTPASNQPVAAEPVAKPPVKAATPAQPVQPKPVVSSQPVPAQTPAPVQATAEPDNSMPIVPPRQATTPTTSGVERLRSAPASNFTIQLLASANKSELLRYIQANALDSQAMYYQTQRNGQDLFVLVYGLYTNRSEAQAALQKLPASIRAQQPWIKSMDTVKASLG